MLLRVLRIRVWCSWDTSSRVPWALPLSSCVRRAFMLVLLHIQFVLACLSEGYMREQTKVCPMPYACWQIEVLSILHYKLIPHQPGRVNREVWIIYRPSESAPKILANPSDTLLLTALLKTPNNTQSSESTSPPAFTVLPFKISNAEPQSTAPPPKASPLSNSRKHFSQSPKPQQSPPRNSSKQSQRRRTPHNHIHWNLPEYQILDSIPHLQKQPHFYNLPPFTKLLQKRKSSTTKLPQQRTPFLIAPPSKLSPHQGAEKYNQQYYSLTNTKHLCSNTFLFSYFTSLRQAWRARFWTYKCLPPQYEILLSNSVMHLKRTVLRSGRSSMARVSSSVTDNLRAPRFVARRYYGFPHASLPISFFRGSQLCRCHYPTIVNWLSFRVIVVTFKQFCCHLSGKRP